MKKVQYSEFNLELEVKSDYKCGFWKFHDNLLEKLNKLGQDGWKVVHLFEDDIKDHNVYFDEKHNRASLTVSCIMMKEIEEENNITG